MATAKERQAQRVTERIPHPGVAYAYLELEASNVNEFESLRNDVLASDALAHYRAAMAGSGAASAQAKKTPTLTAAQKAKLTGVVAADVADAVERGEITAEDVEAESAAAADSKVESAATSVEDAPPAPAPASTPSTEGLSPREIARQKLLAKKGA